MCVVVTLLLPAGRLTLVVVASPHAKIASKKSNTPGSLKVTVIGTEMPTVAMVVALW